MQWNPAAAARDASSDFDGLLRALRAGRPSAWDQCYRWLAPRIAGYLRMRGAREVDDLTSEVFLAVFRNIATFTGTEANFRSWVFVIAHRRLQDERRRRLRRAGAGSLRGDDGRGPADVPGGDVEDDALRALAGERVHQLCARLAPDQADVLLLRILGDLTVEQVAEVVGKSPGAVKQLQRRAFATLRRHLARERRPTREGVPL